MISVILIADKSDAAAVETLAALVEAVADGVLRDAILVGPPSAELDRVADAAGASRLAMAGPRAAMIKRAATQAKSDWLFIVTAGCVPTGEWISAIAEFPADRDVNEAGFLPLQAKRGFGATISAALTNFRSRILGRADPRHGLLMRKSHAVSGAKVKLTQLDGRMIDRRR